jgi:hypothetical protein
MGMIYPLREILDAIFYGVKSGCAWRLVPHDFPPWKTVHHPSPRQEWPPGTFRGKKLLRVELHALFGPLPGPPHVREAGKLPVSQTPAL